MVCPMWGPWTFLHVRGYFFTASRSQHTKHTPRSTRRWCGRGSASSSAPLAGLRARWPRPRRCRDPVVVAAAIESKHTVYIQSWWICIERESSSTRYRQKTKDQVDTWYIRFRQPIFNTWYILSSDGYWRRIEFDAISKKKNQTDAVSTF